MEVSFVDSWRGEAAGLSVDGVTAWVDSRESPASGVSVCGDESAPEAALRSRVDVSVPHDADSAVLSLWSPFSGDASCGRSLAVHQITVSVA